eukprot:CAMPEP_0197292988 /NCGR_PEP_ID=MMETSP0890-20130614/26245_1 /TAXON_ID=44058 ORGANISM="Aureoumbra lagunensis, Strain CCMP1510" /NCGR_SAMPLE_ID=MMETSP0890 /ASSEMBLY_ACC=CAM_ASM_000533 /LENGTH=328 /DNA_ID=CAMNT_0042767365 /DNA_START=206 /DNA_END=1192 /DNA_ORIENTATION=+
MIRIASYNVLSPKLKAKQPKLYLKDSGYDERKRMQEVCKEIREYEPQLVALQEVEKDFVDRFASEIKLNVAAYAQSGGKERTDGCLVLYDSTRFSLLHSEIGILDADQGKVNAFAIAVFNDNYKTTNRKIILATTHLLFNPKRGDIRFLQTKDLAINLAIVLERFGGDASLVLCGDFNSTPGSAVYSYLSTGIVNASYASQRTVPPTWTGEYPHYKSGHNGNGTAMMVHHPQQKQEDQILNSPLPNLASAYAVESHDRGEPAFTTYLPHGTKACVDYLFYDQQSLFPINRLELPPLYLLRQAKGLPANTARLQAPSDHLLLIVDFAYR